MSRKLIVLLLWCLTPTVSAQHEHEEPTHHKEHREHGEHVEHDEHAGHGEHAVDVVRLTHDELNEFGIVVDTAGPGTIRKEILVPGEIAVNGDRIAHIFPRFTGVVKQVNKTIGDQVRTGDVLAVVESNEGLTPYDVKALMNGTVIDKKLNVGEVHHGNNPAFVIADLDTVWVNLSIYQRHLADVRVGQQVAITTDHGLHYEHGIISYISPVVDQHTRTATARVVLDNRSQTWRPGLLVEGRIATHSHSADIAVPKTALFHFEDADVVFILTSDGFKPQPVQIGRTNRSSAEIIDGLHAGQAYAARGGFTIKADLQKGTFSAGHSH